jgi:hypothetical protein
LDARPIDAKDGIAGGDVNSGAARGRRGFAAGDPEGLTAAPQPLLYVQQMLNGWS